MRKINNFNISKLIFISVIFMNFNAFANNGLSLLQGDWKGRCRLINNGVKDAKFLSLRNSYAFQFQKFLTWTVISFKDKQCRIFNNATRFTHRCESTADKNADTCTEIKIEESKKVGEWKVRSRKNGEEVLVSEFSAKLGKRGEVLLTSTSVEMQEPETESLTK